MDDLTKVLLAAVAGATLARLVSWIGSDRRAVTRDDVRQMISELATLRDPSRDEARGEERGKIEERMKSLERFAEEQRRFKHLIAPLAQPGVMKRVQRIVMREPTRPNDVEESDG